MGVCTVDLAAGFKDIGQYINPEKFEIFSKRAMSKALKTR